jgi:hypothetical protein
VYTVAYLGKYLAGGREGNNPRHPYLSLKKRDNIFPSTQLIVGALGRALAVLVECLLFEKNKPRDT